MGEAQPLQPMTAAEYLEWEPAQLEKYQYIHGEVLPWAEPPGGMLPYL